MCQCCVRTTWQYTIESECIARFDLPVALASTLLLVHGRISAREAGLAEVAREMLLWSSGAIGKANVVTITSFVSASHCGGVLALLRSFPLINVELNCCIDACIELDIERLVDKGRHLLIALYVVQECVDGGMCVICGCLVGLRLIGRCPMSRTKKTGV
jgi:hypothetical protein